MILLCKMKKAMVRFQWKFTKSETKLLPKCEAILKQTRKLKKPQEKPKLNTIKKTTLCQINITRRPMSLGNNTSKISSLIRPMILHPHIKCYKLQISKNLNQILTPLTMVHHFSQTPTSLRCFNVLFSLISRIQRAIDD